MSGTTSGRVWAGAAAGANLAFVVAFLVAAAWQGDRYSPLRHSISDMYAATAPHAWVLIVVLTFAGVATVGFGVFGLWPAVSGAGWWARAGVIAFVLSILGLGDLLTPFERLGCRVADTGCTAADQVATAGGRLDATLSTVGAILLVASAFLLAATVSRIEAWKPAVRWLWTAAIALAVLLAALGVAGDALAGLAERLFAAAGVGFVVLLAVRVRRAGGPDLAVRRRGTG